MVLSIALIIVVVFFLYFFIDMLRMGNSNKFLDKWVRKVLWIWLPFYGLWRLSKEVFGGKK